MSEAPPLIFERRIGGLFPVNPAAREAVSAIYGKVTIKITKANRNQRRRALYWITAGIVADALNDVHGLNLTEAELHDITRRKLGLFDEIALPSGDMHVRYKSTADKAMAEPERAAFTDKAFRLWSRWIGVPVDVLTSEARAA